MNNKTKVKLFKANLSKLVYNLKDAHDDRERDFFEEAIENYVTQFFETGDAILKPFTCEYCNAEMDSDLICQECD
jgi:hypothetical protein